MLYGIKDFAKEWDDAFLVGFVDCRECASIPEFTKAVERAWGEKSNPTASYEGMDRVHTLSRLADRVASQRKAGRRPVLCLDNIESLVERSSVFTSDFFSDLCAICLTGLSIVTASRKKLGELFSGFSFVSPFYNIFAIIPLPPFTDDDVHDFFVKYGSSFTDEEQKAIAHFAKGHPLHLNIACHHVLEAKRNGESLTTAILKAFDDVNQSRSFAA